MNKKLAQVPAAIRARFYALYRAVIVSALALVYGLEKQTARFVFDERAMLEGTEFTAPIMTVIAGIIWVICTPIFVNQVDTTSTTGWNFTGAAGAITLFQLLPFIFIAGGVIWIVKTAMK
jgi:hypothetical protein